MRKELYYQRQIEAMADDLIAYALSKGISLEISRQACQPLAMGNIKHVVTTSPLRESHAMSNESIAVQRNSYEFQLADRAQSA